MDRLSDVRAMIADALDVLGAEEEVRAGRYAAWILHHVGQELAKKRIVEGVDAAVAGPHGGRDIGVLARVGIEYVLQLPEGEIAHVLHPDHDTSRVHVARDREDALADVLGQIARPFEIAGDPD